MPIVGDRPEQGVRVVLERSLRDGPPWYYRGEAVTPDVRFQLVVTVEADSEVRVDAGAAPPADLTSRVRRIVRSVCKHALEEGGPPPRRIARWRGDP